ncbi:MAG: hypothetical protein LBR80_11840 [Deltaproteobacteria bacterium]|jgi:hypothetical protein|nr:hypothetical protein [Deltaproteobacteria bacterium]
MKINDSVRPMRTNEFIATVAAIRISEDKLQEGQIQREKFKSTRHRFSNRFMHDLLRRFGRGDGSDEGRPCVWKKTESNPPIQASLNIEAEDAILHDRHVLRRRKAYG